MAGPDVFDQLLSAQWRGIEFPVTRMRVSIAHDLAEHKAWGLDGARVESTGLAPQRYTFSAPLLNGISPGQNERWAALYPNQLRALLFAFQRKQVGELQHPEFGVIKCKAERCDLDWEASRRGGVDAELSFIETLTDADAELREETPVKDVDIGDLDSASTRSDLKALLEAEGIALPPYLEDDTMSLGELAGKIKAVADFPALLSYRAMGQLDALVYQAGRVADSASAARSALTWPIARQTERIKAAAHGLKETILAGSRTIAFFRVPAATTLAGVARQIPDAKVGDLVRLNPGLMRAPEIQAGTVVRYYRGGN